eukprot:GFUD01022011.1.p1 GENE.GFUD01022011.1~~GFUD01022011.1.p1  ORF type:complete len:631 (-),score=155.00 GFUD01022011.1:122-2014(-)
MGDIPSDWVGKPEDWLSFMETNLTRNDLLTKIELIDKFGAANYTVFALMLLVSAGIGVFFWWKGQSNTEEFLMASRSMGTIPMTMSLVASFMSAITLLGTPAEMYVSGTQYTALVLSYPLVMGAAAHLFLPVFDTLKVTTSYEYLELRFDKSVRVLAGACFTLQMVLYMAIVVYAPALALSQVTGFNLDIACAVIFIVCIFYTAIGGIKAVMWTDTFQATCMFGSFLAIIIKGNYDAGGSSVVFDKNYQTNRIELFNFEPDMRRRHTVWGLVIGGFFTWISIYGINQTQVQRYLTVKKRSQAVKAIWWNVLGIGSLLLICAYAGLVVFAFYHDCDPISTRQVEKKDQLFPLFVMQVMGDYPGVPGLFVAGVFSGALSTVSSGLNSLAAVCLRDFIQSGCNIKLTEARATFVTKMLAVGFGILGYAVVFLVKYLPGVLEAALGIFGIVGGPVLGAFTLGMFFPFANTMGAFVGCFSSLIFTMWMGFGQTVAKAAQTYDSSRWSPKMPVSTDHCPLAWFNYTLPEAKEPLTPFTHLELYEVSYMWFSAVAWAWCVVVGIILSLFKPTDHRKLDKRLISPALPSLFAIWPRVVRDWINDIYDEIGADLEDVVNDNGAGAVNMGFVGEKMKEKM